MLLILHVHIMNNANQIVLECVFAMFYNIQVVAKMALFGALIALVELEVVSVS